MMSTTIDPVCGMNIERDQAAGQSEFQGETYYFCSEECKHIFDQDPTVYVTEQAAEHSTNG